jgi:uncharacterized membrane protein
MKKLMVLFAALLLAAPILAHEGHDHDEAAEAKVAAAGSALATDAKALGQATGAAAAAVGAQAAEKVEAETEPLKLLQAGLHSHLHNKIVHFTLALGVIGALFYLLSLKWPHFLASARLLLALGLAAGAASIPTGAAQADEFAKGRLHDTLELHALLGKVSLGLSLLLLILTFLPKSRKFAWLVAVAAALLVMVAGGLGGVLATS